MVFEAAKIDLANATSSSNPQKPKNRIFGIPIFSDSSKFLTNLIELRCKFPKTDPQLFGIGTLCPRRFFLLDFFSSWLGLSPHPDGIIRTKKANIGSPAQNWRSWWFRRGAGLGAVSDFIFSVPDNWGKNSAKKILKLTKRCCRKMGGRFLEVYTLIVRKTSVDFVNSRKLDFRKSDFAFCHVAPVARDSVLHENTDGIFEILQIYWTIRHWNREIHEFLEKKAKKTHPFLDGIFSN